MKTIVLIGSNVVLNAGLRHILNSVTSDFDFFEVQSLSGFVDHHSGLNPNYFILTVDSSNETDHLAQIAMVRSQFPKSDIVIYDNQLDLTKIPEYLRSDVQGYLSKRSDVSEISECLAALQNGKRFLSSDAMDWVLNKFCNDEPKKQRSYKKGNLALTQHELSIARYLSAGMRTSVIAKKIGRKLSTVSTIKYNIFKKLNVDNIIDLKAITETYKQMINEEVN